MIITMLLTIKRIITTIIKTIISTNHLIEAYADSAVDDRNQANAGGAQK